MMNNQQNTVLGCALQQTNTSNRRFKLNRIAVAQMMLGLTATVLVAHAASAWAETTDPALNIDDQSTNVVGGIAQYEAIATLPVITVQAQSSAITDAYAGGQVAAGGRLGVLGNKSLMDTPFNVVSYTDKYVADKQAQNISDVIAATDPTVFSNGVTGAWSENYSIRGFGSNTSDITVDGMFGMAPYYRTSPEMYERIEVLKGPSALLNGMPPGGSVGGTVNLVPKRAGEQPLTRLTVNYMSDAQFGGHIDLGRRFGEEQQFGVRFNGVYRDGAAAIKHQDKKVQLGSLGLDWRGQRARLSADLYLAEDRIDGPTRGINLAAGLAIPKPPKPNTLLNPEWGFAETKDKGAILRAEYDLTDQIMAYAAFGQSKTEYKYNGTMTAPVFDQEGNFKTSIGQLAFDVEKKSADVGFKGGFSTGAIQHQWAANATYYKQNQDDYGRRNVPGAEWISNIYHPVWGPSVEFVAPHIMKSALQLNSFGLADTLSFAQDQLQLTLGLRHQQVISDSFDIKTGARTSRYDKSATTPGAALLIKATDRISVYANYIEGLSQGAKAPLTAANDGDEFAPYKTKQKELGLKLDLGEFTHTFSVFEINRPNSYTDPVTNIFSFGGEQRNRGVEWGMFGAPVQSVRLMGGIAYVDPKLTQTAGGINQGKIATGVAKLQGKLGAEWDVPMLEGLSLTGNAVAVSKQYINADNSLSVPGRTTFDIGARYNTSVDHRPLTLRGSVNNLTNKAYWGMPLLSNLALGAPRTFMLSASMDF